MTPDDALPLVSTPLEMILRLSLAAGLGGILGLERELKSKPAGFRTHMMVSLGAACFSLAAFGLAGEAGGPGGVGTLTTDPTRVVQGIVTGIGFLGAGAILRGRGNVEGLTTASSIWLVGAIGIAAGAGNWILAGVSVVLALTIMFVLGHVEHALRKRSD